MADILDIDYSDDSELDEECIQKIAHLKKNAKHRKGRGFYDYEYREDLPLKYGRVHNDVDDEKTAPQRSVQGWILFVTNIHEEAAEDDLEEPFSDYGLITNLHFNMDRRTGFKKGYALVQYKTYEAAFAAKEAMNDFKILGVPINVDWCFVKGPKRLGGH